jgi:hypothetical protein
VTNKGFGYSVALPVSQWITPGGFFWLKDRIGSTYWPTLDVAFREAAKLGDSTPYTIAMHPNHSVIHRRTILEVHFTPEEAPEEQAALTDMRFDCITRWIACSNRGELLPAAAMEDDADSQQWEKAANGSPRSICPAIEFRAREEQEVLVAKIVSSQAAQRPDNTSFNSLDKWLTYARVEEVVNSPPPNRRWLRLRLKAGLIGHAADYTTLKSSSGSGGFCSSIYRFQTSSVTFPLVATQYPRAHRCWPQYRFRNRAYSLSSLCELFPFRYCTARDTEI